MPELAVPGLNPLAAFYHLQYQQKMTIYGLLQGHARSIMAVDLHLSVLRMFHNERALEKWAQNKTARLL
jgi:hypothetical protein